MVNPKNIINLGNKHFENLKSDKITLCEFCNYPINNHREKLIKCSICGTLSCSKCVVFIDDISFCPSCMLSIARKETTIIIYRNGDLNK